jgi:hypothetical protein
MRIKMPRMASAATLGVGLASTLWMGGVANAQTTAPVDVKPLGESCGVLGCSSVVNDSAFGATAWFNWCMGGGTGASTTTLPTCDHQKPFPLSPRGDHTPYDQDWDVLEVDAGWCFKVKFIVDFGTDFTRTYDRRGKSALYVKAADNADAHVQAQSSSSCP